MRKLWLFSRDWEKFVRQVVWQSCMVVVLFLVFSALFDPFVATVHKRNGFAPHAIPAPMACAIVDKNPDLASYDTFVNLYYNGKFYDNGSTVVMDSGLAEHVVIFSNVRIVKVSVDGPSAAVSFYRVDDCSWEMQGDFSTLVGSLLGVRAEDGKGFVLEKFFEIHQV